MWKPRAKDARRLRAALWQAVHVAAAALIGVGAIAAVSAARQNADANAAQCRSNLKQLALGVLMYVQDYDETYPPMLTPAHVQHRVMPYIRNAAVFKCPETGEDYLPNPALTYRTMNEVPAPARTVVFRDNSPHRASGSPTWNVAYADGHVAESATAPKLGKPVPQTRAENLRRIRAQIAALRRQRGDIDRAIVTLQTEERRLRQKH